MKHPYRTPRQAGISHPARRRFIQTLLGATASLATSSLWATLAPAPERSLSFTNLHTGESLQTTFWTDGQYHESELAAIDQVLRDHRSGEVYRMDPQLLELLYLLQQSVAVSGAFHIISGYRSPKTNAKLHSKSNGVAKRSLHMQGRAVDIRLPGCELKDLRGAALSLQVGGVGYYAKSNFIHVDTGRVRRW